jgi:hypothetical protein
MVYESFRKPTKVDEIINSFPNYCVRFGSPRFGLIQHNGRQTLHEWCVHNRLFNAYYEVKFKKTPNIIALFTGWNFKTNLILGKGTHFYHFHSKTFWSQRRQLKNQFIYFIK